MEIEKIMACYCKTRETQAFYTKYLDYESLTPKAKDLIIDLIKNECENMKLIKNYFNLHKDK